MRISRLGSNGRLLEENETWNPDVNRLEKELRLLEMMEEKEEVGLLSD